MERRDGRRVGIELPGTDWVANTERRFSSNSLVSASIGASPESPGPDAEESIPTAVAVVDVAFMGAFMGVGPVEVRDELKAKARLGLLGVKLAEHSPFWDDKRVCILLISAEEG